MRVFAIYSDFVVREMGDVKVITVGEVGRFSLSENDNSYTPYEKPEYKPGMTAIEKRNAILANASIIKPKAYLNRIDIPENGIQLNKYFTLNKIHESKDGFSKAYFKRLSFNIRDISGEKKYYYVLLEPFEPITFSVYQDFFKYLKNEIEGHQTFREIKLAKDLKGKKEEIELLKRKATNMKD